MKKFLLLMSVFGLCACDFQETPKCWDAQVQDQMKKEYATSGITHISAIKDIREKPMRKAKDFPEFDRKVTLCTANIDIVIEKTDEEAENRFEEAAIKMFNALAGNSEKITKKCVYVTYYSDTPSGKKADYEVIECE